MYSDLLDVLGNQNASLAGGGASSSEEKHVVSSFKAGKMNLQEREGGRFWVTPDTRRGSVELVWSSNSLKWTWLNRRNNNEVVDSFDVISGATFERIDSPTGRVFLLSEPRTLYWMQDASDEGDDEIVVQVNQYLANPEDARPEGVAAAGGGGGEDAALQQAIRNSTAGSGATPASANQVDALSNILENLGMPQNQSSGTTATTTGSAPTGTLTLADLQGAMTGLSAPTAQAVVGPPLSEVVTGDAISSLLEDEAVCNRLLELLPENQRSLQYLEDNLRSPQVQATLRSLTQALLPDDVGSMEGYNSIIANFQLDPNDGQDALTTSNNPIQAFLDCIVASVKKEEETKEEETKDDDAMEE